MHEDIEASKKKGAPLADMEKRLNSAVASATTIQTEVASLEHSVQGSSVRCRVHD